MDAGRVVRTPHFVLHQWQPESSAAAGPGFEKTPALFAADQHFLGALTPKRWAKRAVTRNLIKRQIRQVFVDHAASLQHTAYVVRLKAGFDPRTFHSASSQALKNSVRQELTQLFGKLLRLSQPSDACKPC